MNQDKLETTAVFGVGTAGMEGPSVTLHTDGQEYKQITWMFGPQKSILASCNIRDTPPCEITLRTDELKNTFRDRLKIDNDGSLTIKNISIEQAGLYTLQIFNKSNKKDEKKFNVSIPAPKTVNDSESSSCSKCVRQCSAWVTFSCKISSTGPLLEVEYQDTSGNRCVVNNSVTDQTKHCQCMSPRSDSVGVGTAGTEGSSVTLHTAIQKYMQIKWMFGPEKWIIARCNIRDTPLCEITDETSLTRMNLIPEEAEIYKRIIKTFRDRLKIDNDGSLTIKNISDEHAGLYTLQIFNKSNKKDEKKFNVSVSSLKTVNDSKCSECVRQCSVENATQVTLSWIISSTAPFLEVEYQDTNGNSCVVNNSITDLTKHCQCMSPRSDSESGLSPWLIGGLVLLGVAVAAAAVIFYKNFYKKRKAERNEAVPGTMHTMKPLKPLKVSEAEPGPSCIMQVTEPLTVEDTEV